MFFLGLYELCLDKWKSTVFFFCFVFFTLPRGLYWSWLLLRLLLALSAPHKVAWHSQRRKAAGQEWGDQSPRASGWTLHPQVPVERQPLWALTVHSHISVIWFKFRSSCSSVSSVVTNLSQPQRAGAVPSLIRCRHHRGLHEAVLCIILHCTPKTPVTTLRLRTRLYIQIHYGCRCFLAQSYIYTRPSNITYINDEL